VKRGEKGEKRGEKREERRETEPTAVYGV